MICVFPSTATDFATNGLCVLMPSECTVSETLNGEWELEMTHPLDDQDKWTFLQYGNIIKAPVPASATPRVHLIDQNDGKVIYKVDTRVSRLNLRSGPSTEKKILSSYRKGTEVVLVNQTNDDWYEVICPDGKRGYMSTEYLEYVRTESSAAVATGQVIEARQLRDQPFRIYRVVPTLTEVQIYARHIFYDLMDNMILHYAPGAAVSGANVVRGIMDNCQSPHEFTIYTDLTGTAEMEPIDNQNPVEALLGDEGVSAKFKGELARDWYDVYMVQRVGVDSDVRIRQGKNLLGISYDVDETDVATRIIPTGEDKDGEILYLPEVYIDSENISSYPHPKWYHLSVSDAKESDDEDEPRTKAECYEDMRAAAQELFDNGCDMPTVTLDVDMINVSDTVEYAQYRPLTDIFLGDSVRVIVEKPSIEVALRMTEYTYDCLLRRYTKVTLGTAADTLESATISSKQIASGSITGLKLAPNSIGAGQLQNASVGSLHVKTAAIGAAHIQNAAIQTAHIQNAAIQTAQIADATITRAKIAEALIETLTVNALTAVTARIEELVAGTITTDELYVSIAAIAVAQITEANIENANINWANIETLAARIAQIAQAQITTANINQANIQWATIAGLTATVANILNAQIESADIDWANIENLTAAMADIVDARIQSADIDWASITTLTAAVATMVTADIGTADIDWAHIKDLTTDTAIITQGVGGELYIAQLAVTEANLVSLTVGELIVKGTDGGFYAVSVDGEGNIVSTRKQVGNADVGDVSINAGEKLIEGSVTAATLNVNDIFANNAIIKSLIAANLDVDTLFARAATITALNAADITGNEYLRLMVAGKADTSTVNALADRMSTAELKITDSAIVSTVTSSTEFQQQLQNGVSQEMSEYYTKSQMDTRFSQTDAAIALKVDSSTIDALGNRISAAEGSITTQAGQIATKVSQTDFDNLTISGRNLVRDSAVLAITAGTSYNAYSAIFTGLATNTQYALSIGHITRSAGSATQITWQVYDITNSTSGATGTFNVSDARQSTVFTSPSTAGTWSVLLYAGIAGNTTGNVISFYEVKLEQGNKPTAWTLAPEDLISDIGALNSATQTLSDDIVETAVNTTEHVLSTVADNYAVKHDVDVVSNAVNSLIQQTATDIELVFQRSKTYTIEVTGEMQQYIDTIQSYQRFSEDGLELGVLGSPFVAKLGNTRLSFLQSGEEIAYISNNKLFITAAQVTNRLTIGNEDNGGYFDWITTPLGLALKWRSA